MASIRGKVEAETDFIFLSSKVTADSEGSHEIKILAAGKENYVKPRQNLKMPTKVYIVKAMVFPVVMYRCESWTIKKAKCQRIDGFELWCWRKTLEIPFDFKI